KQAVQQSQTVEGRVTDKNGAPLSGVTVQVKGTTVGTSTDENGHYSIKIASTATLLTFSAVGYTQQEIAIQEKATIDVVMSVMSGDLEEVVVVGYGTQRKESLTGSITTVDMRDKEGSPTTNVSN